MTPEELRAKAKGLIEESDRLRTEANKCYAEASRQEAEQDAAELEVGMTVTLRSIPLNFVFAAGNSRVDGTTPMIVERLGRVNATISRTDGGEFPFPRRNYQKVVVRRTALKIDREKGEGK